MSLDFRTSIDDDYDDVGFWLLFFHKGFTDGQSICRSTITTLSQFQRDCPKTRPKANNIL